MHVTFKIQKKVDSKTYSINFSASRFFYTIKAINLQCRTQSVYEHLIHRGF